MAVVLQKPTILQISSGPLKASGFQCIEMGGHEKLSEPFRLTIKGRVLGNPLDFENLMGKPTGVALVLGEVKRYFHGHIGAIEHLQIPLFPKSEHVFYQITLDPLLGLLRHTQDCRIFQEMTGIDIIKKVLQENHVLFTDRTVQCGRQKQEFCVQYNESHFHFVSRLMETYGIFYYFTMTSSEHRLILADDADGYKALSPASYSYEPKQDIFPRSNRVLNFKKTQQVVPQGIGLNDFFFETPDKKLYTKQKGHFDAVPGQIYQYPGNYTAYNEGESLAKLRLKAEEFLSVLMKGNTSIAGLFAGSKFQLKNHPEKSLNKNYVAFEVEHRLAQHQSEDGEPYYEYVNCVTAFPDAVPYHPLEKTPKPRIYGTQTAIVTGKSGEEIWTEEYGRVKVKFHWDIRGKEDETSSCWIRVSYPWASQGWGFLSTPRIGQEVVVSYLEGDPDYPLIVGCVYNGTHKPPYLPKEPTKSTFKSNTSKGGEGFNELRFEDKKGEEEVYVHAQKDATIVVEDSRTTDIQKGSCTTTIHRGNRSVTLKGDDKPTKGQGDDSLTLVKGSRTIELQAKGSKKGNLSTTLQRGDDVFLIKQGDQHVTLQKGNQGISLRKGNRTVTITGNDSLTVKNGNLSIKVKGGNITIETSGNETHKVSRNMKLSIGGNLDIDAKGSIRMDAKMGVKINGNVGGVKLNGLTIGIQGSTTVDMKAGALVTIKGMLVNIN